MDRPFFAIPALALVLVACPGKPRAEHVLDSWLSEHRPVEPRLSPDRRHRPCAEATDPADLVPAPSCDPLPDVRSRAFARLSRVRRLLRAEERDTPSADTLHSLGLWHLLWSPGGEPAVDAVKRLEEAVRARPGDPDLYVDLAAAHLVVAAQLDDPESLVRALEAAEQALQNDPGSARARFNRALALEELQLEAESADAWESFLEVEVDPAWRDEAKRHLQALAEPDDWSRWSAEKELLVAAARADDQATVHRLVDAHRQAARNFVERDLLPTWAEARAHGERTAADSALTAARAIASALEGINGERSLTEAVAAIDRSRGDRSRLRHLVSGHRALAASRRDDELGEALSQLRRAESQLERGGSRAMAATARFSRALKLYDNNSYDAALSLLEPLSRECSERSYHYLGGRAAWLSGTISLVGGEPARARQLYQAALDRFEASGELGYAATLHGMVAASYVSLGAHRPAWRHHLTALRRAVAFGEAGTLHQVANTVGDFTVRTGDFALSLEYQNLAVENAARLELPHLQADALIWRAFLHSRLGRPELGRRDLSDAAFLGSLIPSAEIRARTEADLHLVEASIAAQEDPAAAIEATDAALPIYEATGNRLFALIAYTTRAGASWRVGDLEGAELDLERSIALHESFGRELPDEWIRLRFADQARSAFDEMIRFQLDERDDPVAAFRYAERERRLSTPAAGSAAAGAPALDPIAIDALRRALPDATHLVTFSVLEGRLLAWVLGAGGFSFRELDARPGELRDRIDPLLDSAPGEEPWIELGGWLYDQLLRPWIGAVPAGDRLVIVPDKLLHTLPYPALYNRDTGRYLIEERALILAPSATLFLDAVERDRQRGRSEAEPETLVVADPAFDAALHAGLLRLPAALAEGEAIQRIYAPRATLLSEAEADRERFVEAARGAERIHFAGHGVLNASDPLRSMLVLAPGETGSGELTASDIYELELPRTRLVTLSACDTAVGDPVGGESAMSLARPFLAAGVPAVVASLWKVGDLEAAELFVSFHRKLESGLDAATALREAQLLAIDASQHANRRPPDWSAFRVIGGVLPSERPRTAARRALRSGPLSGPLSEAGESSPPSTRFAVEPDRFANLLRPSGSLEPERSS